MCVLSIAADSLADVVNPEGQSIGANDLAIELAYDCVPKYRHHITSWREVNMGLLQHKHQSMGFLYLVD